MNEKLADNHAEFMAVMAKLANTMEANAAATVEVVQRLTQPARSRNDNGEGAEDSLRGVLRTLAAFRRADPSVFNGSTNHIEADNWFRAMERTLLTQHEAFYRKYFHGSLREARELELLQLKQGSTTIVEYISKFKELYRFSRISQGTSGSCEGWKCIKYKVGLREDIRRTVAPLEMRIFSELVDTTRVVEEYARTCGNYHPDRPCQLGKKLCYKCGAPGHLVRDYRRERNRDEAQNQQSGLLFTLDARDVMGLDPPMRVAKDVRPVITNDQSGHAGMVYRFRIISNLGWDFGLNDSVLKIEVDLKVLTNITKSIFGLTKNFGFLMMIIRVTQQKLYAKLSTCEFEKREVKFLGHVVSKGGITVDPSKTEIQKAQQDKQKLQKLSQPVGDKRYEDFAKDGEGLWRYKGRICIPDVGRLRQDLLSAAHYSGFPIHPGRAKM
ncbi:uncharacterized protein LOC110278175 [Arachis duranensis]|uniref:Uncharacterized protein LOC110278175 n=1 Tax=Arachis duranensis TaxID=130453 RepID=A0A6P5NA47_ARADU|nr:uncharacterized protein LOC110278175 [Arachis duranensis]